MNKPLPEEVKQQIADTTEQFRQQLTELWQWVLDEESEAPATALEIEKHIRDWTRRMGEDTQAQTLGRMERYRVKGKQACPECGQAVYWTRYEPRQYISSLGELTIERAYYHHSVCHTGWVPLDARLELGNSELSPLVQEMASYLGAWMPYEQAVKYLTQYQGIQISHDSVNSSTVSIGQALQAQQSEALQRAWETQELPACEVESPPARLYISTDGIRHLLPSGEGKEIKVAAVYETEERQNARGEARNPRAQHRLCSRSYRRRDRQGRLLTGRATRGHGGRRDWRVRRWRELDLESCGGAVPEAQDHRNCGFLSRW